MHSLQGSETVNIAFARELADQNQCLLLGVLVKTARKAEFANRRFFNLDPQNSLPSAQGDLILDEYETPEERVRLLVVPLDLNEALEDIGRVHGVLIKSSDFQTKDEKERLKSILEVLESLPEICQIDEQTNIERVMDRSRFLDLIPMEVKKSEKLCSFPNSFTLQCALIQDQFLEVLHLHEMEFPLILKTVIACGDPRSHFMALVTDASGLDEIKVDFPLQVQQFHHHGDSLYKVYIIGNKARIPDHHHNLHFEFQVFIQEEKSLDILSKKQDCSIVHFDALEEKTSSLKESSQLDRLDIEVLRQTAIALKSTSGLNLFGFDVIVDDQKRHFVIDVNYFPSMKRIENSIGAIHELCHSRIRSHQRAQNANSM